MSLLPMDYACLRYLVEHGENGSAPTIAIPSRMFQGDIPIEFPSMVELGLIEHDGNNTAITAAGREELSRVRDLARAEQERGA